MPSPIEPAALAALRSLVGNPTAGFRDGQLEAITTLVADRSRVLCVQRTGWGKSAVYFVATRLLREAGSGPTLLVSPLLALMRNQIEAATRGGIRAATINSDNRDDWETVFEQVDHDAVDILLVSPERFANQQFRRRLAPVLARSVGLLVIDEAHCISDWGHDFRPDYRRIAQVLAELPRGVPALCTTATANDRVIADISHQLGDELLVLRGPLERESLALDVVELPTQAERLAWLAQALPAIEGSGIVYALTIRDAELIARWLTEHGIEAAAYTGAGETADKQRIEQRLQANTLKAVVATSALGMGYDKPDLAFVVHFQSPGSAIAYYQQVGRAGRSIDHSVGVLLAGTEDERIQNWFIDTAFPPRAEAESVVELLASSSESLTVARLEQHVNLRRTRLTNMLKQLEVDGAVERDGSRFRRSSEAWVYPQHRVEHITAQRRHEQARMREYIAGTQCYMQHLRSELDDPSAGPCGRCAVCLGRPLVDVALSPTLVAEAAAYLRGSAITFEPRKQHSGGARIAADSRNEIGHALCRIDDGGWGVLARAHADDPAACDELVAAFVKMARTARHAVEPTWVTAVPSARRPGTTEALARKVAAALRLEFVPVVRTLRPTAPQSEMQNSAQQEHNVVGAFEVSGTPLPGPVYLVDDLVDSRWTLTMVGLQLRDAGSGPVVPLVLAAGAGV